MTNEKGQTYNAARGCWGTPVAPIHPPDMTYEEFQLHMEAEILKKPNFIMLECLNCGKKQDHHEGDMKYLYDNRYKLGCPICGGKMKCYGSFENFEL